MARIEFEGNLGAAPELRHTKSGSPVLGFRVADSKSRKTDSGDWEKLAEQWLNVSVWGDLGEMLAGKLDKGTRVRVIGEFYSREYEGQNGKGLSLDVKAWGVDVLTRPQQSTQRPPNAFAGQPAPQHNRNAPAEDPWAGTSNSGGWGNSQGTIPGSDKPPF